MLIPLSELRYEHGVVPGPVCHVGAHLGEEAAAYQRQGFGPVTWIEANPDVIAALKANVARYGGGRIIQAAVADTTRYVVLHVASNGQSTSILPLGTHATEHPDVTYVEDKPMFTSTIDQLLADGALDRATFMNVDVQGAELDVLKGATIFLQSVEAVYVEVNEAELYEGCALLPEMDAWLFAAGFRRRATRMTNHQWGDALYCRV